MEVKSIHFRGWCWLALGGLLAALACVLPVQAAAPAVPVYINDSHSYSITSTLDNGGNDAYIGVSSNGNTLTITAPGTLVGVIMGYIGDASANNMVTVTGAGATWNLSSYLYVGNAGSFNSLNITGGASVTNYNGIIGNDLLAHDNRVWVTGSGSIWDNSGGDVFVGNCGYANSLTINNGGQVFGGNSYIGITDPLTGGAYNNSVYVSGSGSIWRNSADLYVGCFGYSNSLIIDSGGMVSNSFGFIGYDDGSIGSSSNKVLVTGAGSIWSNAADLVIGHGNGSSSNNLTISAGGIVYNNYGTIGKDFTANNNSVLVTGSGSIWSNSLDLYVGETGCFNSLTLASGGRVFSANAVIGSDANANNNRVLVTGAGSGWTNSGDLWVGWNGSSNSLTLASSGYVANANGYIGDGTVASNNAVVVAGGAVWGGGDLFVGNNGSYNSLAITNGGQVFYNNSYIGRTAFASNNSVLVSGSGSVLTNSSELRVGDFGSGNRLVIANSGRVVNGFGYIGAVDGASNNSALVSGSGSIWISTNGFAVGYAGAFNQLIITNGGVVVNVTTGGVGVLSTATNNSALISGSGSVWSNGGGFVVGYYGSDNQLMVNNGGQLVTGDASIGGDAGATNNVVLVTGSGSLWNGAAGNGFIGVGDYGAGNKLTIANSGQVMSIYGDIGNESSASNNRVVVRDAGSVWSSSDHVAVGYRGSFNLLIITNGGTVLTSNGIIGSTASASNNSALVSGIGSSWSSTNSLFVGDSGPGSQLTVSDNGTVAAPYIVAGNNTTSTGNVITVSGGNLYATNAAGTGSLEIRRGSLTFNSGTVTVNRLIVTNLASSVVSFNGGMLNSGGSTINNSSLFRVGNGLSSATLHLLGGSHSFANGLFINTNAWLTGTGAITGAITVSGAIAPGDSAGIITGSSSLTLLADALLQMQLAGTNAWLFDQINIAGAFNFGGTLTVLLDGYVPQMGDRFDLFDFSGSSGAFSQTNLPALGGALFWNTSLLYTSGEIYADSNGSIPLTNIINNITVNNPGAYMVGTNGAANGLIITNIGVLISSAGVVGNSQISSNNNAWVSTGSLWTNTGDLMVGATGSYNRLEIINTGRVMNSMGYIGYGASANNNSVLVSGSGSIWRSSNGFAVGYSGSFNLLVITNGGAVINSTTGGVGVFPGANNNSALISGSGSVWSNGADFCVGLYGAGNRLTINNGGRLLTGDTSIGGETGATNNSVLVTGSGSLWCVTNGGGYLNIGDNGSGNSLIISAGGQVMSTNSSIGSQIGSSNNSVLVTGSGSAWYNNSNLYVGNSGSGNSLTIANSGYVSSVKGGYIGYNEGAGNNSVLVTGTNSTWELGKGTWDNGTYFQVGGSGSSNSLTIADGGKVKVEMINMVIGNTASSRSNSVVVTGTNSSWQGSSSTIYVGYNGSSNRLSIVNGGQVSDFYTFIGYMASASNNSVLVSGTGSTLSVSRSVIVGTHGYGNSLTIENGATVTSQGGTIADQTAGRNNSVLVTGTGSVWNLGNDDLYAGSWGASNSLTIAAGGQVLNNRYGYIGYNDQQASNNLVLVTGNGSLWSSLSNIYVGFNGPLAQLTISSNGTVTAPWMIAGNGSTSTGNTINVYGGNLYVTNGSATATLEVRRGALNFSGGIIAADQLIVANNSASATNSYFNFNHGTLTTRSGSQIVAPIGSNFFIGATTNQTATWNILGGTNTVTVSSSRATILGGVAGLTSIVSVSGAGTVWSNSSDLQVGAVSSGNQLVITNGGRVVSSMGFIGYSLGANSNSVLVNNALWSNTNGFGVGYGGSFNSLIITNGGAVINSTTGGVGVLPGANYNTALISGSGSVWSNGNGFAIGLYGMGNRLTINAGGRLVTADASFGENAGANSNVVVVTGSGSVWSNRGDMTIGYATVGNQLVISNGGVVRTLGDFRLGTNSSLLNSGAIYVGGDFENAATNQFVNDFSGTNIFNGSSAGGSWVTQDVEVASVFAAAGLGAATNFYFGTFLVGDAVSGSNAWVRLVDRQVNKTGGGNETFGASNVVIALAQSVLDLNNRTSYIRNLSNAGTILQTNAGPPGAVTRLDVVNTFTNAGTVLVGNGSVLQFSNAFVNAGIVELLAGGVLTNFVAAGGVLTNSSSGSIFGDGLIAALVRNDGIITATGGTLRLTAGFSGDALGTPINAGVLRAIGAGATLDVAQSFINSGTIAITNATFSGMGLLNQNIVRVDNQSTATFNGTVTNAAGASIRVSNQSLIRFNGGVTNNGTMSFVNPSTAIITGTLLLGQNGVLSMPQTNNVLFLRGNFLNGSTNRMDFNTRYGMIYAGGSTPLTGAGAATNTFEVASTNRGASFLGFDRNFAVGTLNITNHIEFVNNINNGGGLGTNEALYVDVLHLFNGATLKLSQLTIYVGIEFIYEDSNGTKVLKGAAGSAITEANKDGYGLVNVFLSNGGQIVFVPEPSGALLLLAGAGFAWISRRRRTRQS
ncbi:MAG: PEP-CTERM sorting domain-containing protein [Verrucomicrobiia bacterium]